MAGRSQHDVVLQASFCAEEDGGLAVLFVDIDGLEVVRLRAPGSISALEAHRRVAASLGTDLRSLRIVLPDGNLLDAAWGGLVDDPRQCLAMMETRRGIRWHGSGV